MKHLTLSRHVYITRLAPLREIRFIYTRICQKAPEKYLDVLCPANTKFPIVVLQCESTHWELCSHLVPLTISATPRMVHSIPFTFSLNVSKIQIGGRYTLTACVQFGLVWCVTCLLHIGAITSPASVAHCSEMWKYLEIQSEFTRITFHIIFLFTFKLHSLRSTPRSISHST